MIQKNIKINADTKDANKNVGKLNESIEETGTQSKNTQENLDNVTGGAAGKFLALKGARV